MKEVAFIEIPSLIGMLKHSININVSLDVAKCEIVKLVQTGTNLLAAGCLRD